MKRLLAYIWVIIAISVSADDYNIAVFHKQGISAYDVRRCDSLFFQTDSIVFGDSSERFALSDIDSIVISHASADDTVRIIWDDAGARFVNPNAETVHVSLRQGHVKIVSECDNQLNIIVGGITIDGSLKVASKSHVHIVSHGLALRNPNGEAINVHCKKTVTLECLCRTVIADGYTRSEEDTTVCKACIYTQGSMIVKGCDSLLVAGNYKNAVQSGKNLTTNACIRVTSATGTGIKAKKQMIVDGGSIKLENIGNNGIDVEKGSFILNNGQIDISLTARDTKGIKTDSLYVQHGGILSLCLAADQCKGVRTKKGINILGGILYGTASGGVVVADGDPSYCTFLKSDSDIVLDNAYVELLHSGDGGKCISSDGDVQYSNTTLSATLTGNGGCYINTEGEDDYYTPRAIEADDSLTILSGWVDIHCTGIGGKGMVCDHDLTIGELGGDNDRLHVNIVTEGTSIVNDTVADYRKGCPKAIKSADQLDILSGHINIKTCGMGGEGLESKNELYIVGGNIILDTFDDGVNGEKSINVHGGNIYCCSQDNDGFDSNGCINIFGGNIFSVSLHPVNESFDTEGNTLNIYGGTLLGIGGGTVNPESSNVPFYSYPKWTTGIIQTPVPKITLHEGKVLSIMRDDSCVMSGRIPADMKAAIVTVASDVLNAGQEYNVVEFAPDNDNTQPELKFTFTPNYYYR